LRAWDALVGRRLGAVGLLIRSGDGDLFGQTAARTSARISGGDSCRRAAADCGDRRLIIAAASRRQHHDFTERGLRVLGKDGRVLSVAGGLRTTGAMAGR